MALIIDGNAVYEIDEDCKRRKDLKKTAVPKENKSQTHKPLPKKSYRNI